MKFNYKMLTLHLHICVAVRLVYKHLPRSVELLPNFILRSLQILKTQLKTRKKNRKAENLKSPTNFFAAQRIFYKTNSCQIMVLKSQISWRKASQRGIVNEKERASEGECVAYSEHKKQQFVAFLVCFCL